ncbi:MAG: RES family NAD+ phosphorylase [Myxococcales bacterium]|nr:RES family NAD+ phosphorylase [Myxococcales bacterium]
MPTVAWRIDRAKRRADPLSGHGAAFYPGRWNHRGVRAVYTGESRSIVELEVLVHVDRRRAPKDQRWFRVEIPDDLAVTRWAASSLPSGWRAYPHSPATRDLGTAWLRRGEAAVLAVPSAVIPDERSFILNPLHPDFARITWSDAGPVVWDVRLFDS